jgi:hypothetical protein
VDLASVQLLLELLDLLQATRVEQMKNWSVGATLPVDSEKAVPESAYANCGGPQSCMKHLLVKPCEARGGQI